MTVNDTPFSHCQLIVPAHYLGGGTIDDATYNNAYDGDPDSTLDASGNSDITWTLDRGAVIKWCLVHGHTGAITAGTYLAELDSGLETISASAQENIGQSATEWTIGTYSHTRASGKSAENSLLVEMGNTSSATALWWNCSSVTGTVSIRNIVWSCDFRVPMFDLPQTTEYSYPDDDAPRNRSGYQAPEFAIAYNYRLQKRMGFKWSGLTSDENAVFGDFFDAFGGQIQRPFWLCVIEGLAPYGFYTMLVHELIVDPATIARRRGNDELYEVEFTCQAVMDEANAGY